MNVIAVDVGNSAIKVALAPEGSVVRVTVDDLESLNSSLKRSELNHWVIVSVVSKVTDVLAGWIADNRPRDQVTVLTNDQIPIKSSVKIRAAVGTDRLVAAYAANLMTRSDDGDGQSVVVVDLGTAVTIDYVNKEGTFCGGLIFPGVSICLTALAKNAEALPELAVTNIESVTHDIRIGDDTQSAIQFGVAQSQAWAIASVVQRMAEQNGASVFVTGGGADLLNNIAPVGWKFVPNLILDGCRKFCSD